MSLRITPQRGFSLLEILITTIISIALVFTMTTIARNAERDRKATGFLVEQMQIEQSIRELYKNQMDYSTLNYSQLYQNGLIPPDLQYPGNGNRGLSPWGLIWNVFPAASTPNGTDSGAAIGFNIYVPDRGSCISVGRQLAPRSYWLQEIYSNTVITTPPTVTAPRNFSVMAAAVDSACNAVFHTGAPNNTTAIFQYAAN